LKKKESWVQKMPVIFWVIAIPAVIFLFFAAMIMGFWALATVEGVASIFLIIAFVAAIRVEANYNEKPNKIIMAIGIAFFALMGMSVDQPGNFLYNPPIGWVFCPPDSGLIRYVNISNPLPGTTYVIQEFRCVNEAGNKVKELGMFELMIGRFAEYVIIAYALIYLNRLARYFQKRNKTV
jgi:hypothetical protein